MYTKSGATNKRQSGFTLLELLVALALCGVIVPAIVMAINQVWSTNELSYNRMAAARQVENTFYTIGRDVRMAQNITSNGSSFPLNLYWTDWDNISNNVTYYLLQNGELKRAASVNGIDQNTTVARNINSSPGVTTVNFTNYVLAINVTVSITGFRPVSETRIGTFVSNAVR